MDEIRRADTYLVCKHAVSRTALHALPSRQLVALPPEPEKFRLNG